MQIEVNQIKTHYLQMGDGQPLIILHGWGSRAERWIALAEILSQRGLRVIIPDLPGFGESETPSNAWTSEDYLRWFAEFIRLLKINEFYLLGYSFGGALSFKIALRYPQQIKKLFLICPALIRKKSFFKKIVNKVAKVFKKFSFLPGYSFLKKVFYFLFIPKTDYLSANGIMKKIYLNIISDDQSFKLSLLKVPTVIIWGAKDKVVPLKDAYFINKKIENSKLIIIPHADHLIYRTLSDKVAEKIIENL